jgi:Undecaprenyl-phosphate galactose phosphotransferase WbaP
METIYQPLKKASINLNLQAVPRLRFTQRYARWWMTTMLVLTDLISLFLASGLAIMLRTGLPHNAISLPFYIKQLPIVALFIFMYAWKGLYPAVGLSPVDELHHLMLATSTVFMLILVFTFWAGISLSYSRLVIAFAWVFALIIVQFNRWLLRILLGRMRMWGEPVAIIGSGSEMEYIATYLNKNMRLGMRPAMLLDGRKLPEETTPNSIKSLGIQTAILLVPDMSDSLKKIIIDERRYGFQRLILISSLGWVGSLGVTPFDMEGVLGLEVRQNLFNPWDQLLKRLLDITIALVGGLLILPLMSLISILIKLDSPGPLLYSHARIGRHGKEIKVWKFRSMVTNADEVLKNYLKRQPGLLREWKSAHKIKYDPRVTKLGKVLRRLSLDELPQLWNVLKGDMSLVGPRPIVPDEIPRYNHTYTLYKQVRPGMTGLWQVSGRSDNGYGSRVRYDEYYIRNWSIWLDIYILIRTIWVVLRRDGAY